MARFGSGNADILENKAFLYVCFIIATISLIFFANVGDGMATAVFLISGYLISLFTKKMAIVLLLALVISYIYKYGVSRMAVNYSEGFGSELTNALNDITTDKDLNEFLKRYDSQTSNINGAIADLKNASTKIRNVLTNKDYINSLNNLISKINSKIGKFMNSLSSELRNKNFIDTLNVYMDIADKVPLFGVTTSKKG